MVRDSFVDKGKPRCKGPCIEIPLNIEYVIGDIGKRKFIDGIQGPFTVFGKIVNFDKEKSHLKIIPIAIF